ncbi:MAG: 1-phosphofructokinase [Turicibacter sp.]|uniref:Tagatose-6-phosphate kinase n=1 Tax=Turicibacter faecis TaxID=2963365 RepID=A0ABN6ZAC5_9FIRM|nr:MULTISPECIES: 1-phosphofructokinase [unclassified Turicibacter]MCI8701302.1 1-phosphofructokinase [Turicibacter sp.]BEH90764.1 tagatose-6-phosphate kinase [Turicibacter sp. TC023]MCI9350793.1 1-phosphofructokinase [Turicibacter sp.]MCU7204539.1 1-phosphofructokinase [Turicibacter sp. TA25]MCU7208921.1 1-phosphofructokinase [Turicibacter sp. 1E2]
MIYTVTLNPSIDYVVNMEQLVEGMVNRVSTEHFYAGGKGINVSQILNQHGISNRALGFISGFTGNFIEGSLKEKGIDTDFIRLSEGYSRINMKIKTTTDETEINGMGPHIPKTEIDKLYRQLDLLTADDTLVLAGSIPATLPDDFYEKMMEHVQDRGVKVVVDATKNLLLNVLTYRPFLIKPNHHEIAEMFGVTISTTEDLLQYGNRLKDMGARNVLISMGGDGAILLAENGEVYRSNVPKGVVKNSVGAGDSMVAGFIAGYEKTQCYEQALRLGAASGSATAFSSDVATAEEILALVKEIVVQKL